MLRPRLARAPGAVAAAALGVAAALVLHHASPDPAAEPGRGGEEAFATGLYPRELPPRAGPLRWTRERAVAHFRQLPRGPAALEVEVRGHRAPVTVAVDGVIVGVVPVGAAQARFALPDNGGRARDVELRTAPFQAGDGRLLGTQLRRVTLRPGLRGRLPAVLAAVLAGTVAAGFLTATAVGAGGAAGLALAASLATALVLALWPVGVVRSPYALAAVAVAIVGCAWAAVTAAWIDRKWPGSGRAVFAGLLLAVLVQGLAATSPVMVVSDAVFHANNLARVAGGNLWITSQTQHSPPFRFPYGVSFYALLTPFFKSGVDGVWLVRAGAAVAGLAGSAALAFLVASRGGARAGLAVAALQILPVTFDLHSYGNLSNVFSQAVTAAFFAWWAAGGPGGWAVGALLVAVSAVGHFSSFVVMAALSAALAALWWRERPRSRPLLAAAAGLAVAALYYGHFVPLLAAQLPRLGEGAPGGGGRGVTGPLLALVRQWGLPMVALAVAGLPRRDGGPLDRDLRAYWLAGGALAIVGLLSPLEVRYLHALSLPLAVAAAEGSVRLWSGGTVGRVAVVALWLGQAALAAWNIVEAVLWRYRL
jgi:hypothetical protein